MSSAAAKLMIEKAAELRARKSSAMQRTESSLVATPAECGPAVATEHEAAPHGSGRSSSGGKPAVRATKRRRLAAPAVEPAAAAATSPTPEGPETPAAPIMGGLSSSEPSFEHGHATNFLFDPRGPHYDVFKSVQTHTSTMAALCMQLGVVPPVSATQPQLRFYLATVCGTADSISVDTNTAGAFVDGFTPAMPDFVEPTSDPPAASAPASS